MPSKQWYLLPAAIFILGSMVSGYVLFSGIASAGSDLIPIASRGETSVALLRGNYTIFVETRQRLSGISVKIQVPFSNSTATKKEEIDTRDLPALLRSVAIVSPTGKPVGLLPFSGKHTYSINDRHGSATHVFIVDEPGVHRFSVSFDPKVDLSTTSLSIAPSGPGSFPSIFLGVFGFYFSGAIAVAIAIFIYLRRETAAAGQAPELTRDRKVFAMLLTLFFFAGTGSMLVRETYSSIMQLSFVIGGIVLASTATPAGIVAGLLLAFTGIIWGIVTVASAKAKPAEPSPALANRPPRTPRT